MPHELKHARLYARLWRNVLLACAGFLAPISAAIPALAEVLRPGVVYDAERGIVALMRPDAGIDLVDLGSGETIWTSRSGDMPLAFDGRGRLVAMLDSDTPELILIAFEPETGGEPVSRIVIQLPEDVLASVDDGPDRRFTVQASASDGTLDVAWQERFQPVAAVERFQKDSVIRQGAHRVSIDDGKVEELSERDALRLLQRRPPDLIGQERMQIESPRDIQFRGVGDRYAMTSVEAGEAGAFERYAWTIWDRETGRRIGAIRDFQRVSPFAVIDRTLLQEVTPHIRTLDGKLTAIPSSVRLLALDGGDEIWSREIRDTEFRGPLPH